jgi:serine/threonine-protein kinase
LAANDGRGSKQPALWCAPSRTRIDAIVEEMSELPAVRSAADLEVGSAIDRYEIVRHVARGGMGSVWLARFSGKHGFEKRVAIKTIRGELATEARFRAMFLDEARTTARLSHANIAQVLDVGEKGALLYIVFEWVDGKPLEQLCNEAAVDGATVPVDFLIRRTIEVCAGLHAAHELKDDSGAPLGIVHRDVSPMNVMISAEGFAKVIDFGVAKARDRIAPETRSGVVKGTPQYMAPEQASGDTLDRRADIWAIGATLHRALTGVPPFSDRDALAAFIGGKPMDALPGDVDPALREIVMRALAREPERRYETAEEMRVALEEALLSVRVSGVKAVKVQKPARAMEPTQPEARAALAPPELAPSAVSAKSIRPKAARRNLPLALVLAITASIVIAALALAMWGSQ